MFVLAGSYNSNLVGRLTVASANPGWQTIPERGVVRSREPCKFWWAPTISPERLKLAVKFCMHVGNVKSQHKDDKSPINERDQCHVST